MIVVSQKSPALRMRPITHVHGLLVAETGTPNGHLEGTGKPDRTFTVQFHQRDLPALKKLVKYLEKASKLGMILFGIILSSCGSARVYVDDGSPISGRKFLVAGQSNSVSPPNGAAPTWSQTGLVSINDYYHDRYGMRVPTQADPNDSGYTWIYFGDLLEESASFNLVGNGNTSTRVWVDRFHTNIVSALKAGKYSAVLWVQGESDALEKISAEESYRNLRSVIEESRTVQPDLIWYLALDGFTIKDGVPVGPARQAQQRLISEGLARQAMDMDALRISNPECFEATGAELVDGGFQKAAKLWLESLQKDLR